MTAIVRPSATRARTPCQPPTTTTASTKARPSSSRSGIRHRSLTETKGCDPRRALRDGHDDLVARPVAGDRLRPSRPGHVCVERLARPRTLESPDLRDRDGCRLRIGIGQRFLDRFDPAAERGDGLELVIPDPGGEVGQQEDQPDERDPGDRRQEVLVHPIQRFRSARTNRAVPTTMNASERAADHREVDRQRRAIAGATTLRLEAVVHVPDELDRVAHRRERRQDREGPAAGRGSG